MHSVYRLMLNFSSQNFVGREILTRFRCLGCLVDEYGPKFELAQTRITAPDTRGADDIRGAQDFFLALPNESLVLSLIVGAQLSLLVLEEDELLQLDISSIVGDLSMQGEECDR